MNSQIRVKNLAVVLEELKQKHNVKSLAKLADVYDINPTYISQLFNGTREFGEKSARNLEKKLKLSKYTLETSTNTANVANVSIGGNNTGIIGGVGNTQNNYELEQTVLPSAVADEPPAHLKDMPLLDIDDAVAFALDPTNLNNKIYATVQHISAFIPHSARTFAIKNDIDLSGIGEVLRQDDTLIFEPAMQPRNGDVVLICLDYGGANRGIVARLGVDLMGHNTIKYDDNPPTQMPPNSLICGVLTKFVHQMHNVDVLQSRLNPNYDILSTLVTE